MKDDQRAEARHPFVQGLALLWRSGPVVISVFLALQAVSGFALPAVAAATGRLVDTVAAGPTPSLKDAIGPLVVITVALMARRAALTGQSFSGTLVQARFTLAVESGLLQALGSLPGMAHLETSEFHKRVRMSSWAGQASNFVNQVGFGMVSGLFQVLAAVGVLLPLIGAPWCAALLLPSIPMGWVGYRASQRDELSRRESWNERLLGYTAFELGLRVAPSKEIRLFGLADWVVGRCERFRDAWITVLLKQYDRELTESLAVAALKAAISGALVWWVIEQTRSGGLTVGELVTVYGALAVLVNGLLPLEQLPGSVRGSLAFLPDFLWTVGLPGRDTTLASAGRTPMPEGASDICFENVGFTYPGSERPVVEGLNLRLGAGAVTALVGENGAGKSTIVKLLCRYYDPDEGRITAGGIDIRELDLAQWRAQLGAVFQDFVHWPMTLVENVTCGSPVDPPELDRVAEQAGLTSLVGRLSEGWDTTLDRRYGGTDLSGGEWQRIGLARALLESDGHAGGLLLLDEPTAALDVRLEHALYNRFVELAAGRTTLLISHRLSTVRIARRIAVLAGGRIVEEGSHEELVSAGGAYSSMWVAQASRFAEPEGIR